jgi:hypothetical protein
MYTISSYPKIYNLGHPAIAKLFDGEVVVEEKVDGSQFSAMRKGDDLFCRSKGAQIDIENPPNLFEPAVKSFVDRYDKMIDGMVYRGEALHKPKHNTIKYARVPNGNVIIFDIDNGNQTYMTRKQKVLECVSMGFEFVPKLAGGVIDSYESLKSLLDTESALGGSKIEGFVIKNYNQFGRDGKVLMGKWVSEAFKEVHNKDWKGRNPTGQDIKQLIAGNLRNEARWEKAVQYLRDKGELTDSPKDIGPFMRRIVEDVEEEQKAVICEALFQWAWKDIKRGMTRGAPEWYKDRLAKKQFGEGC